MERGYIDTEKLSVGYGKKTLIRDIALHVRRGEIVTLIGPNGAGKSTILKTISGELKKLGGTVYLGGDSMAEMKEAEQAKRMAVVMTERIRPELMTCYEVAAAGRYPYTGRFGLLGENDRKKVKEALELVNGLDLSDRYFTEISDGQKQRILLARAICQEPEAIVLDEPTSFLDIRYKLEILSILKELVRSRKTAVLMSLHELELAQKVSDFVVCVDGNAIGRVGTPEEIFCTDYIRELYRIGRGTYQAEFGSLELEKTAGEPRTFVIGGGGAGLPVYRLLHRKGIPFAAGILHENDVEYHTAKALAARVVSERPFEAIGERAFEEAKEILSGCDTVVCCPEEFGTMNRKNEELAELGKKIKNFTKSTCFLQKPMLIYRSSLR